MRSVFIISEYNPFHRGHAFQIEEIRRELAPDAVISLMSGNFVQRGEPAVLDKFSRAALAIAGGSDLVLELPVVYAASSAEFFARGGVAMAGALDPLGTLSFGSECGEINKIVTVAGMLLDQQKTIDPLLKANLALGLNFPRARARAFETLSPDESLKDAFTTPNDILAVEYVKASLDLAPNLRFHTIRRRGMAYHDRTIPEDERSFPSATALRRALLDNDMASALAGMPPQNQTLFRQKAGALLLSEERLKAIIQYRLSLFPEAISRLPEAGDGLGERIVAARSDLSGQSLHDFALQVKTRRLTYTRIRRLLLHLALGFDTLDYDRFRREPPRYARILALNEKGRQFMAATRKTRTIHVVQTAKDLPREDFLPDRQAGRLYSLLNPALAQDADFTYELRIQR